MSFDNGPILVKISQASKKLGFSKEELIKAEKQNSINNLIIIGLEANNYHIKYSTVLDYKNNDNLEELRYLEYLSDSLHLPLSELLDAKEEGLLEDYLSSAGDSKRIAIDKRCVQRRIKALSSWTLISYGSS